MPVTEVACMPIFQLIRTLAMCVDRIFRTAYGGLERINGTAGDVPRRFRPILGKGFEDGERR